MALYQYFFGQFPLGNTTRCRQDIPYTAFARSFNASFYFLVS